MKKHLKILLVSTTPRASGGIARWTKHILKHDENYNQDKDTKIDLSFLPISRSIRNTPQTSFFKRIKYGIKDYLKLINEYRKKLTAIQPSVVHFTSTASFGLLRDIIILQINRIRGIKSVFHLHNGKVPKLFKKKNVEWEILKYVVRKADKVIVLDTSSFKVLKGVKDANIEVLPNPISPNILSLIGKNKKIQSIPRRIVFVGHVIQTKGVFELVKACLDIPDIQLVMLGKGPAKIKSKLSKMAKKKDDEDWLKLMGHQPIDVVVKEMLTCSVFVLPTHTEGFPNVILESMACGCAIVTTPVGAIPEMLNVSGEGQPCGTCVEVENVNALTNSIKRYMNNEKLAEQHGSLAKAKVVEEYSMSSIWQDLTHLWEDISVN